MPGPYNPGRSFTQPVGGPAPITTQPAAPQFTQRTSPPDWRSWGRTDSPNQIGLREGRQKLEDDRKAAADAAAVAQPAAAAPTAQRPQTPLQAPMGPPGGRNVGGNYDSGEANSRALNEYKWAQYNAARRAADAATAPVTPPAATPAITPTTPTKYARGGMANFDDILRQEQRHTTRDGGGDSARDRAARRYNTETRGVNSTAYSAPKPAARKAASAKAAPAKKAPVKKAPAKAATPSYKGIPLPTPRPSYKGVPLPTPRPNTAAPAAAGGPRLVPRLSPDDINSGVKPGGSGYRQGPGVAGLEYFLPRFGPDDIDSGAEPAPAPPAGRGPVMEGDTGSGHRQGVFGGSKGALGYDWFERGGAIPDDRDTQMRRKNMAERGLNSTAAYRKGDPWVGARSKESTPVRKRPDEPSRNARKRTKGKAKPSPKGTPTPTPRPMTPPAAGVPVPTPRPMTPPIPTPRPMTPPIPSARPPNPLPNTAAVPTPRPSNWGDVRWGTNQMAEQEAARTGGVPVPTPRPMTPPIPSARPPGPLPNTAPIPNQGTVAPDTYPRVRSVPPPMAPPMAARPPAPPMADRPPGMERRMPPPATLPGRDDVTQAPPGSESRPEPSADAISAAISWLISKAGGDQPQARQQPVDTTPGYPSSPQPGVRRVPGFARGGAIPDEGGPYPNSAAEGGSYTPPSAEPSAVATETTQGHPAVAGGIKQVAQQAAAAVDLGLRGLAEHFGGGPKGAVPTPESEQAAQQGAMRMARGEGAATPEEIQSVDFATGLDQHPEIDDGMKNIIRIDKMVQYHLQHGNPEDAKAAAMSGLMTGQRAVQHAGVMAATAFQAWQESGDPQDLKNATAALKKAYSYIPDGNSVDIDVDPKTRQLVATITSEDGDVSRQVVDPRAVPAMLQKLADGSAYWKGMYQVGQPEFALQGMRDKSASARADQSSANEQARWERNQGAEQSRWERNAVAEDWRHQRNTGDKAAAEEQAIERGKTAPERDNYETEQFYKDWNEEFSAAGPDQKEALVDEALKYRYQRTHDRPQPVDEADLTAAAEDSDAYYDEDLPLVGDIARELARKNPFLDGLGAGKIADALVRTPAAIQPTADGRVNVQGVVSDLVFNPELLPHINQLAEKYRD